MQSLGSSCRPKATGSRSQNCASNLGSAAKPATNIWSATPRAGLRAWRSAATGRTVFRRSPMADPRGSGCTFYLGAILKGSNFAVCHLARRRPVHAEEPDPSSVRDEGVAAPASSLSSAIPSGACRSNCAALPVRVPGRIDAVVTCRSRKSTPQTRNSLTVATGPSRTDKHGLTRCRGCGRGQPLPKIAGCNSEGVKLCSLSSGKTTSCPCRGARSVLRPRRGRRGSSKQSFQCHSVRRMPFELRCAPGSCAGPN